MADFLKKPLGGSINDIASRRARDAIDISGKSLPAKVVAVLSSGIVTVDFEVNSAPFTLPQVTVPIEYPEYIRYPIQVGDTGLVISADARLGGITGLGGGVADLTTPANLAALSFVWLGSAAWAAPDDPQALVLYGPSGVWIRDSGGLTKVKVLPTGVEVDLPSGKDMTVNVSGGGKVIVNGGDVFAGTVSLKMHKHTGGTISGDTGVPIP